MPDSTATHFVNEFKLERAVVLTNASSPWVSRQLEVLLQHGVEVLVVNETTRRSFLGFKFLRRRGLLLWADLLLLIIFQRLQRHVWFFRSDVFLDLWKQQRRMANRLRELKSCCKWRNVAKISADATLTEIQAFRPQIVLLCGAPILSSAMLKRLGPALNAHCGILPEYRGSSPFVWAILKRDWQHVGYTIHLVTSVLDAGPAVFQETVDPAIARDLRDLDWKILDQMHVRIAELACTHSASELAAAASPIERVCGLCPPAGLICGLRAGRRLRRHGREARNRARGGAASDKVTRIVLGYQQAHLSDVEGYGPETHNLFRDDVLRHLHEIVRIFQKSFSRCGIARNELADTAGLEVGCAWGFRLNQLLGFGLRPENLYGIDLIEAYIRRAKTTNPTINFTQMSATGMSFPDGKFDFSFAAMTLSAMLDEEVIEKSLDEMCRVSRRFVLIIDSFNPGNQVYRNGALFFKGVDRQLILRLRKCSRVRRITRIASFWTTHRFPWLLYRVLRKMGLDSFAYSVSLSAWPWHSHGAYLIELTEP